MKLGNLSAIYATALDQRQDMVRALLPLFHGGLFTFFFKDDVISSDWITIGVVITVSETKKAKNKSEFCVVKLNDLVGHEASLFLFNESFRHYHSLQSGTVIAVLNPSFLTSKEVRNY